MNYIRHLNAFFVFVRSDDRLACSHVSLYLALFQYWNFNRFQNPFPIYRDNLMQLSKIGSKNTYHKCIKELHQAGYILCHPSTSKFRAVKISMLRLDIKEEEITKYQQLDMFNAAGALSGKQGTQEEGRSTGIDTNTCTGIETDSVPNLTATSTETDTGTVSKMGHNIKPKQIQNESKTRPQNIFDKNKKLSEGINRLGAVPNSVHDKQQGKAAREVGFNNPVLSEVEEFFLSQNYPVAEAKKFFNHYKAIGWKIKGITPIEDWEAAAHKWMFNSVGFDNNKQVEPPPAPVSDAENLYKLFLAGQPVFKQITTNHFDEIKLQLTNEIMSYAWQQRINQLTGSNQYATLQLLQAYQDKKENDPLLIKDSASLLILAKRIAVIVHFNWLKENNTRC